MEGIRYSDLSQSGNRPSIEAMRHDNPRLPPSELTLQINGRSLRYPPRIQSTNPDFL